MNLKMNQLLLALASLFLPLACGLSSAANAQSITAAPARTAYLIGEITGGGTIPLVMELMSLKASSKEPITLVVNSPGGSVTAGYFLINALNNVTSSGIQVNCVVSGMAASMAFNILMHCSHTYAFAYSLLLWHPPRAMVGSALTPDAALQLAIELHAAEQMINPAIISRLNLDRKFFYSHYHRETLWIAKDLVSQIKQNFLTLIDRVDGVESLVFVAPNAQPAKADSASVPAGNNPALSPATSAPGSNATPGFPLGNQGIGFDYTITWIYSN